jgi:hypothetical protein
MSSRVGVHRAAPYRKTFASRFGLGETVAIVALLILAMRTTLGWLCRISMPTTWDYGPAQLAIAVDMFVRGAPLYPDFRVAPFIPLPYAPVVPSLTAKLAPMFGAGPMAALEAGRLLTMVSTIVACAMIFFLAHRIGASVAAALLAALGFMLSPIVLRWGFEYRVDMPVLACTLGGIVAFTGGATTTAIALFVVSFFIKQGHAIGIATVMLFCWTSGQRRRAITFAAIWLTAVAAGTALLAAAYPHYLLNSFGAVRTPRLDYTAPVLFSSILIGGNLGVTILASIALTRRRATDRLMLCLLIVASLHSLASCLRWGSNAYYFLPTLAALAIIASPGIEMVLERMRALRSIPQLAAGAALASLLCLGFMLAPRALKASLREVTSLSIHCEVASANRWDPRALDLLHSIEGPIFTDAADLNLVDSQPNLQWIELMVLTSMQEVETFDDAALLDAIRRHQIAAFALDADGLERNYRGRPFFWPRLRGAIEANYAAVPAVGPPYLLLPKKSR